MRRSAAWEAAGGQAGEQAAAPGAVPADIRKDGTYEKIDAKYFPFSIY